MQGSMYTECLILYGKKIIKNKYYILPNKKEIRFVKKRIKFCGVNTLGEYVTAKAGMHDSMIVIF